MGFADSQMKGIEEIVGIFFFPYKVLTSMYSPGLVPSNLALPPQIRGNPSIIPPIPLTSLRGYDGRFEHCSVELKSITWLSV